MPPRCQRLCDATTKTLFSGYRRGMVVSVATPGLHKSNATTDMLAGFVVVCAAAHTPSLSFISREGEKKDGTGRGDYEGSGSVCITAALPKERFTRTLLNGSW